MDRLLRFVGTAALVTLLALGTAFFASGEWEAWKAVRDARPDLAVADLRTEAAARDAKLASASEDIAALKDKLAAARRDAEAMRKGMAEARDEIARLEDELGRRVAYGDTVALEAEPTASAGADATAGQDDGIAVAANRIRLMKAED